MWKEIRVGALCGFALGIINLVRIFLLNGRNLMLSLTVTLSLFCTIIVAKTIGCSLPMLAKRLKIDPALMASPMITTIVDAISLTIYFSMAKAIFHL